MVILDANIVIVALPSIEADLGFSEQGLQWEISALPGIERRCESARRADRGFQSAFVACVVLAAVGMALALLLLAPPPTASDERLEPVPATAPAE